MKVTQSEFVISAVGPDQYPDDILPEIALAGRSNVGKSSLINRLISRKNLARKSSTPGKTQTLNYYRVNNDLYFVDFPGYGYAKVSKTLRQQFGKMIEQYLLERQQLKLILQIIDIRHVPSAEDRAMYDWLLYYNIPLCIVVTKADKIPKGKWQKHMKIIRQTLNMNPAHTMVLVSAETGHGKDELWSIIKKAMIRSDMADDSELDGSSSGVEDQDEEFTIN